MTTYSKTKQHNFAPVGNNFSYMLRLFPDPAVCKLGAADCALESGAHMVLTATDVTQLDITSKQTNKSHSHKVSHCHNIHKVTYGKWTQHPNSSIIMLAIKVLVPHGMKEESRWLEQCSPLCSKVYKNVHFYTLFYIFLLHLSCYHVNIPLICSLFWAHSSKRRL